MFFPLEITRKWPCEAGQFHDAFWRFFLGRDCEDWVGVNKTTYLNLVDDVDVTSVQDLPWSLKKEQDRATG